MNSEVTKKSVPTLYGTIKRVPQVDNTLTKAGCYADAKAVGDILRKEQRAVNLNKPTGSYAGDGSITKRTFNTEGIGNIVFVTSKEGICFVTDNGAISKAGTTLGTIDSSECSFINGVFTLKTTNDVLNKNGVTYNYQVL